MFNPLNPGSPAASFPPGGGHMAPPFQIGLYGPKSKNSNAHPNIHSRSTHGPSFVSGAKFWSPPETAKNCPKNAPCDTLTM